MRKEKSHNNKSCFNETLKKYERYASLWIPELLYGSSNLKERDIHQSVLKTFIFCCK